MMRKAFGTSLKAGDAYIRKGSHQTRLMRQDLDRIFLTKNESGFTGVIQIGFDTTGTLKEQTLPAAGEISLPSDLAAKKIKAILAEREQGSRGQLTMIQQMYESGLIGSSVFGSTPYAQRKTKELQENLEQVKITYEDDDLYELYEVNSAKINLSILNEDETYVEDTSVRIEIQKSDGLLVARRINPKPSKLGPFERAVALPSSIVRPNYPSVKDGERYVEVRASIGNLRHGIPTAAFAEPLRIVLGNDLIGQKIYLCCTLYGKQLRTPRTETLTINVSEPDARRESLEKT
jgi:hypothetical protein